MEIYTTPDYLTLIPLKGYQNLTNIHNLYTNKLYI